MKRKYANLQIMHSGEPSGDIFTVKNDRKFSDHVMMKTSEACYRKVS